MSIKLKAMDEVDLGEFSLMFLTLLLIIDHFRSPQLSPLLSQIFANQDSAG